MTKHRWSHSRWKKSIEQPWCILCGQFASFYVDSRFGMLLCDPQRDMQGSVNLPYTSKCHGVPLQNGKQWKENNRPILGEELKKTMGDEMKKALGYST